MEPKDRELVTRSISNLWTFNALFIGQLLYSLRERGMPQSEIDELLEAIDRDTDAALEGEDDKLHAASLLASVRVRLGEP